MVCKIFFAHIERRDNSCFVLRRELDISCISFSALRVMFFLPLLFFVFVFPAQASTCGDGALDQKPRVRQICSQNAAVAAPSCDPALKTPRSSLFLPFGLRPLRCEKKISTQPAPQWLCRSVQMLSPQKRCECTNPAKSSSKLSPYPESILLRKKVDLPISAQEHKLLIAAILARDPVMSLEYSKTLRKHQNPELRFAATLSVAYALAKQDLSGNHTVISRLVSDLYKDASNVSSFPVSDADFLSAILALDNGAQGKARRFLDSALSHESTFFNAAVLTASLQLQAIIRKPATGMQSCLLGYRTLLENLQRLVGLEACPRMAVHMEAYLSRQLKQPEKNAPFLVAQVYLAIMAWRPDQAGKALARFSTMANRTPCRDIIAKELVQFVDIATQELSE